jgi:hypothetical protein
MSLFFFAAETMAGDNQSGHMADVLDAFILSPRTHACILVSAQPALTRVVVMG